MTYTKPTKKRFRKLKLREKLTLQQLQIKQLQTALARRYDELETPKHDLWEKKGELYVPSKESE